MNNLQDWFSTPLGQYLLEQEMRHHDNMVADIFGFHAVQLGLPGIDFLRKNRIPHKFILGEQGSCVLANFHELPLESQSIDLLVLPHVLEFTEEPHAILREIDRVMMPEGRIIITSFNPWSLWGMRRWLRADTNMYPWCGDFISLVRMKDWLSLLGFEVSTGKLGCYVPPVMQEKWISRFGFMEDAGDRWWAIGGGIYMIEAIKRVHGMRIIIPAWRKNPVSEKRFAAVSKVARRSAKVPNLRIVKNTPEN